MDRDDISPVAQAAIAHAQFETDPSLRRRQRPRRPLPDPGAASGGAAWRRASCRRSASSSERTRTPTSTGSKASATGAVDAWVRYFAGATELAALNSREFSEEVEALQSDWRAALRPVRADSAALALIDLLPRYPVVTAAAAESDIGRSGGRP